MTISKNNKSMESRGHNEYSDQLVVYYELPKVNETVMGLSIYIIDKIAPSIKQKKNAFYYSRQIIFLLYDIYNVRYRSFTINA